jgi:hypothetical protein
MFGGGSSDRTSSRSSRTYGREHARSGNRLLLSPGFWLRLCLRIADKPQDFAQLGKWLYGKSEPRANRHASPGALPITAARSTRAPGVRRRQGGTPRAGVGAIVAPRGGQGLSARGGMAAPAIGGLGVNHCEEGPQEINPLRQPPTDAGCLPACARRCG